MENALVTLCVDARRGRVANFSAEYAKYTDEAGKKLIVMAMGTPYDILYLTEAKAYLAVYGANQANIHAGMAAIFGRSNPQGKLPVPIQSSGEVLFEMGTGFHY
jgi:beta-N-acetylhexosaminidase